MKEFFKKSGLKLLIIVLCVVLIVGLTNRALSGKAGILTNAIGSVQKSVQKAAGSLSEWLNGIYGYMYGYDQLKAENDALRAQLAEAREEARRGRDAVDENNRLRALLDYLEPHSDYETQATKITSWSASNWESSFTISKGEKHGIELGDCVITEYGALVGVVTELGSSWATVRTVIDVDTSIGVLIGDDESTAMLVGDYALMQDGCAKLTYLSETAQMFMDDEVITSGKGGAIPQGLTVGYVTSILSAAGGQTEYGVVSPIADLTSLSQVFVITDFEVIE